jgi:hypothetical protein
MNVEVDLNIRIRVTDEPLKPASPRSTLAALLARITSHPCIVMLIRQLVGQS